jgi:hypothetical protein
MSFDGRKIVCIKPFIDSLKFIKQDVEEEVQIVNVTVLTGTTATLRSTDGAILAYCDKFVDHPFQHNKVPIVIMIDSEQHAACWTGITDRSLEEIVSSIE